ncbi:ParA family protein [Streptacidiphilus neutrinimicus]|uniref:ParA family protein n=1 Tax=Streptacidiphilus neutrinimicus TaxID=105420 RepID=UPI0005A69257|nr:ParA family protein [Streptacidiphilus neutrinimicus]
MASPYPAGDREKLTTKLPASLRHALKVRAAQLTVDLQDAVTEGIIAWRAQSEVLPAVDTSGAESFGTWLPEGLYDDFKADCVDRGVSYIQGLAQAVQLWLTQHPDNGTEEDETRRLISGNQKGGVGKTAVAAGVGEAFAEAFEDRAGKKVLLIDFDPQGHLSDQLGIPMFDIGQQSLVTHMLTPERATTPLHELVQVVPGERFGGRLHLLPASMDAFLLDGGLAVYRGPRVAALEVALRDLEQHYDVIVIDCPPSLGLAMDCALYYARTRESEKDGNSGILIPVEAEDSSAKAYGMLQQQITQLSQDWKMTLHQFGLVINKYDSRKGLVATTSKEKWESLGTPPVLTVIKDLRFQREAVRFKTPLLAYDPECEQSHNMREIVRKIG